MIQEEDVLSLIQNAGRPISARQIAKLLDAPKSEVNSILYGLESTRIEKSGVRPPYWRMRSLEDQVVRSIPDPYEDITAREIAEKLGVSKSAVNSILYRLDGTVVQHDDATRPNWSLIVNDEDDIDDEEDGDDDPDEEVDEDEDEEE